MSGIKNDAMPGLTHEGETAHVDHQIMITEGRSPFSHVIILAASRTQLGGNIIDIVRREKLSLLDVHGSATGRRCQQEIGLAAKKSRDLEDIDYFGGCFDLAGIMDVGQDGTSKPLFDLSENFKTLGKSWPAERFAAGSVGLVKGGFENKWDAEIGGEFDEMLGNGKSKRLRFQDTRSGNQEKAFRRGRTLDFFHE